MNRRQKKGSKNWYKTVRKIKKEYQRMTNIKNNIALCSGYPDTLALFLNELNIPNFKVSSIYKEWEAED